MTAADDKPSLGCAVARLDGAADSPLFVTVEVTPPRPEGVQRPPIDLLLVLDRSSSMVGPRIAAAVEVARQICLRLGEGDRLGVVAFDSYPEVIRPPGPVDERTATELAVALTERGVGFGTNISGGWEVAAELITRGGVPRASRTILLLTDGLPSRGLMSNDDLAALARAGFGRGVVTAAVGIGERFDEELLTRMAHAGGGTFRYAATEDDTVAVADEEVDGLTMLAADRAVLHVGFSPVVRRYEVLNAVPCKPEGDGTAVELGRLFAGRPRAVVVEVACSPGAGHIGAVGLSCLDLAGNVVEVEPQRLMLPAPGQEADDATLVGRHLVPILVARWQRKVWERGRDADASKVREVIELARQDIARLPEPLAASDEARDAIGRLSSVCDRILEILSDRGADADERRTRTEHTLKSLAEQTSNTMLGLGTSSDSAPRRRRGWGRSK